MSDRINTRCPSCGHQSLFIGSGGHLVCSWLECKSPGVEHAITELRAERDRLQALVNTPEIEDFVRAVVTEAAHQRERWGAEHDQRKTDEDWFWTIGYLAGKALHTPIRKDCEQYDEQLDVVRSGLSLNDLREKQLHRIITIAAAAANWHRLAQTRSIR